MKAMDAFTVLAEPTRRSIVEMVARRGELTASDIAGRFDSSPPSISQHLKVLRDAHVLRMEKKGRLRIYRLNVSAIDEVERWIRQTKGLWNARFDRLDALFASEAGERSRNKTKNHNNHGR